MVKKTYMERPIWGLDEKIMPPRKCINYQYYQSEITDTTGPRRFGADMNYWYYRSETGTSGGWRRKAQFCVKMNYRYFRSETGTTGPRPVLPMDGGRRRSLA
jgi:hypothetical protein